MASSLNPPEDSNAYLHASITNVSNFVSVKLSGFDNYHLWKTQMLCLMEAHEMCWLVDDGPTKHLSEKIMKKYVSLLKGWIFGSVSEEVLRIVVDLESPKDVWKKLKSFFDSTMSSQQETDTSGKVASDREIKDEHNMDSAKSEAKWDDATQTKTKETDTSDKVASDREIKDEHNMDSAKSEAKWDDGTQTKTIETDTSDKVASDREIKDEHNMDSAKSEAKWDDGTQTKTIDSAPTKLEKKIETKDEDAETETSNELREQIANGNWYEVYYELKHKNELIKKLNSDGNTLLHIAVGIGSYHLTKDILTSLRDHDLTKIINSDGSTVLHIAAIVGNRDAAELLVKQNKNLLNVQDNKGQTPFGKAYQYMHLDTIACFLDYSRKGANHARMSAKSQTQRKKDAGDETRSSHLPPIDMGVDLLVNAVSAKQYDLASMLIESNPEYAVSKDNVLMAMARTFPSRLDYEENLVCPNLDNTSEMLVKRTTTLFNLSVARSSDSKLLMWYILSCEEGFLKSFLAGVWLIVVVATSMVCWMCLLVFLPLVMVYFLFFMLYFLFWKAAAIVVPQIKNIEQKKKEYEQAKNLLELLFQKIIEKRPGGSSHDLYTRPILEAAREDAYEVVEKILHRWPEAIRCEDNNGYDIIQLATIHRSERIYNLIYNIGERKSHYRKMEDSSDNNMLHLAGRLAPSNKLKRIAGAALQLQRELQWRQEVEKLMFPTYVNKENIFMETPEMVFTKEHENLVKDGEQWMKTVAESCSITATLTTTIVFAAAITVPGGSKESGVPVFLKEIVFTVFAIADAISLFSSATSLLVFLSILTARFSEQDFLVHLPRRLIMGLCTLLISTTSMMVAFIATLFLVFFHHKLWVLPPICGLAFLPIANFFIIQIPLILDLYRSTYVSKFGKSDIKSGRFNPNIPLFFCK